MSNSNSKQQSISYTADEYLQLENDAVTKSEFYKGEIFAMAGAGLQHNIIYNNLFGNLLNVCKGKSCTPFGSDYRLHIPQNSLYTYPDISIYCKQNIDDDTIGKPTVLIEILSNSTKHYDIGVKFELYRDIPTLKEYITIDSQSVHVTHNFVNEKKHWEIIELKHKEENLTITTLQHTLSLQTIYDTAFAVKESD